MSPQTALIVDDEADIRALLEITLSRMGLETIAAADLAEAKQALSTHHFSLCLTDMRLPDGLGIELVEHITRSFDDLPVAVITAYGSAEDAVNSLKAGAFDFVSKPVDVATLRRLVDSALKTQAPAQRPNANMPSSQLSGQTPIIQDLRAMIAKLARNQAPVHIHGESGTGKELVAHMIHEQGPRADHPFVPVNCGAIPSELMESEFFGHIKGSFSGATSDRDGLFQAAAGGTLFLDEVGDLPITMQVKLLRAIQERKVRPVGSNHEIDTDVRIISATHKDLQQLVQNGSFREDLFYRLNVIDIHVPPLRERQADILPIAEELLRQIARRHGTEPPTLSPAAKHALTDYHFPGNIRELENILERGVALAENHIIDAESLKIHRSIPTMDAAPTLAPKTDTGQRSIDESLIETEKKQLLAALEKARFNKTKAAKLLGISFRSFRYRLKKHGIDN